MKKEPTYDVFIRCETLLNIIKNVTDHQKAYDSFLKEHYSLTIHELPEGSVIRLMYNFTDNHENGSVVVHTTRKERLL